ncbi:MAG: hypothetical protein KAI33_08805, partial [Elusimicrobiales bacterium]|nr:hypothetical protein [Elusimicrobiales bacterium]
SIQKHPIIELSDIYRRQTASALNYILVEKTISPKQLRYQFKTLAWHHTLLPAKLHRALAGFYETTSEGDMALYDAVAQLEISKKAINESLTALSEIEKNSADLRPHILHLPTILNQLKKKMEEFEKTI